jgi:hypothetical protein
MANKKNNSMTGLQMTSISRLFQGLALAAVVVAGPSLAMEEMTDAALAANSGQGLLVADKIQGVTGSNHTFYRMALNAELGMNSSIDKLQLGCGGFNDAVVANACDIDIDYVTLMGRDASGGQTGAPGAGAVGSEFKMTRPYIEIAVKNDDDPTRREIIGFKLGAAKADGYMSLGRYTAPGSAGASASCTNATDGAGAFYCHQGINRLSGYLKNYMTGEAFGCFGLFGCTPDSNIYNQYRVATFSGELVMWGTRLNRIQVTLKAHTDPAATMGLSLASDSFANQSLRFIHGQAIDGSSADFLADDFFQSFQREPVRYPTYNKTSAYSNTANPGWWMNIPMARLDGLKAYNVEASLGSLSGIALDDPDIGQRPPDNCFGALKFC